MSARFEEIDWRQTPMGEISLRRRWDPALTEDVYEVKLGEEFLMSSAFTAGEIALARLALAELPGDGLDVVVGGLGLGYTAQAVLDDARVGGLVVVEALDAVIEWHERALLPLSAGLTGDPRCRLVQGDFFGSAAGRERPVDAVLVDIDHSPRHVLHPEHAAFYRPEGLRGAASWLRPGGVFALWSNDPPDEEFGAVLSEVFPRHAAHVVEFDNPLQGRTSANTVYVGVSLA
ncbi:spermidine synthase [Actinomadura sp. DC4]|uniref:spermidine synthase n=1 Tax=Actinomadura sp. DC4 TaxID=3055069 RepID=UPI0025AF6BDE|nr:spermidine synthase [Actinomadura sp. DC4]MDN3354313.1 spermidine synthase [Actinomadura sp. DC4]